MHVLSGACYRQEPPVATLFTRYVVKRLLATACWNELEHFMELLGRVHKKAPQLLPASAAALMILAKKDALETQDMNWGTMPLGARASFVESPLYQEFLQRRAKKHFDLVRCGVGLPEEDRRAALMHHSAHTAWVTCLGVGVFDTRDEVAVCCHRLPQFTDIVSAACPK